MFQEMQKLMEKMREKSDEITHLKTRVMSLIDKSDTLEKGQIRVNQSCSNLLSMYV